MGLIKDTEKKGMVKEMKRIFFLDNFFFKADIHF